MTSAAVPLLVRPSESGAQHGLGPNWNLQHRQNNHSACWQTADDCIAFDQSDGGLV